MEEGHTIPLPSFRFMREKQSHCVVETTPATPLSHRLDQKMYLRNRFVHPRGTKSLVSTRAVKEMSGLDLINVHQFPGNTQEKALDYRHRRNKPAEGASDATARASERSLNLRAGLSPWLPTVL